MPEKITIETVMSFLLRCAEEKIPQRPTDLLDSAVSLNALLGNLDDELAELEGKMTLAEAELITNGESAAKAKILKRSTINYTDYLKKLALKQRAIQHIQICKKRTELPEF